jgi:hypothetical protein
MRRLLSRYCHRGPCMRTSCRHPPSLISSHRHPLELGSGSSYHPGARRRMRPWQRRCVGGWPGRRGEVAAAVTAARFQRWPRNPSARDEMQQRDHAKRDGDNEKGTDCSSPVACRQRWSSPPRPTAPLPQPRHIFFDRKGSQEQDRERGPAFPTEKENPIWTN